MVFLYRAEVGNHWKHKISILTDVNKAPDRGSLLQGTTAIRADVTALTKRLSQEPETLMQLVRYGAVWAATYPKQVHSGYTLSCGVPGLG